MDAPMVRTASLFLVMSAACAAAMAPVPIAQGANSTAELEALVSGMAEGQHFDEGAPSPQKIIDQGEEVVIFEGLERRRLGVCDCHEYRNGASESSAVCSKQESGRNICTATKYDGGCSDIAAKFCPAAASSVLRSHTPQASPGPILFDAEAIAEEFYLNVNLQLFNPHSDDASALPAPDQFAQALARLTSSSPSSVNVITTWGEKVPAVRAGVRIQKDSTEGSAALDKKAHASLHATIAVRSMQRRSAIEALLQLTEELPEINGQSFQVRNVQIFEQASTALVCSPKGGNDQADAAVLLRELVQLQLTEVEMMRQSVVQMSHAGCDNALLRRIASRLGVSVDF